MGHPAYLPKSKARKFFRSLLGDAVFHIGGGGEPGAVCATEEAPLDLDSVTDHFALAMLTNRGHCLNGTFEAVECMARTSGFNNEDLIVFVAADLAICHKVPPSGVIQRMIKSNVLLLLGRNMLWSGDIRHGFRYLFRPILERQIRLRNDPDASAISIDHRDTANLVLLHCLFAAIQILCVATGYRILMHIFLDRRIFWIEALSND